MRCRGLSLLELLLAVGLVVVALGLGLLALGTPKARAETRGVAEIVAEELRLARQTAISRQIPVGVIFPSAQGTRPHSQSLYILEGWDPRRPSRRYDFRQEYPHAYIFVGFWDLDPAEGYDNTLTQPDTGSEWDSFDVTAWPPNLDEAAMNTWGGSGEDYAYVFTPSGTVRTNDLPLFDGEYHIVVTQYVAYEGPSPVSVEEGGWVWAAFTRLDRFFKLTGVASPYTVSLSPLGEVTVTEGVTGADPDQVVERDPAEPAVPPADPVVEPAPTPNPPVIDQIEILPDPASTGGVPPGVDATVKGGDTLTFTVWATDEDGDPLFASWTGPGTFSSSGEVKMEWDEDSDRWFARVGWRPPQGASGGEKYTLTWRVTDRRSASPAEATRVVQVAQGKIAFMSMRPRGGSTHDIILTNEDGTGKKNLTRTPPVDEKRAQISPDGQKIAYVRRTGPGGPLQVFVRNIDGTGETRVTDGTGDCDRPAWSPDSRRVPAGTPQASRSSP